MNRTAVHTGTFFPVRTFVSDEVPTIVHDEAADVVALAHRDLLHDQLVEIAERHVHPHHRRHPVERVVQRVLPEKKVPSLRET